MPSIGERPELTRIRRLLEDPHETALVVVGAGGSGKSHLLTEVHEGFPWESVIVRANPTEAAWPLSGFSTIFSSIGDRRAIEFGGRFAIRAADEGNMFGAANDLLSILRSLQLPPLLVLVDDLDRMDPQSRTLLGAMSGRLAGTHLRVVATASVVPDDGSFAGMLSVELEPRSDPELLAIADAARPQASEGTVRILLQHSAGNPRALLGALGALTPGQLTGDTLLRLPPQPDPGGTERLAACESLDEHARELLLRLATAPLAHPDAIVAGRADALDDLHDLQDAGFADETRGHVRLRDPLLRSALYWSLDARTRRGLHDELAAGHAGLDPRLELWHRAAMSAGSAEPAELLEAAIAFAHDDLVPAAVEFAELARVALAVRGADDREVQALLGLASALLQRGELALAARCTALARQSSPGSAMRFHVMRLRAAIAFLSVKHVEAPELSGDPTDPASSAAAGDLAAMTAALFALCGETAEARQMLEAAAVRGADGDDGLRRPPLPLVADLVAAVENAPLDPAAARPARGPVVEGDRSFGEVLIESETAMLRERYTDAYRLTGYVLERAAAPMWIELAAFQRARGAIRSGRFHEGRLAVADWAALPPAQGDWVSRWVLRAWAEFADERYVEAADMLAQAATLNHRYRAVDAAASLHALRGQLAIVTGDLPRAVHELTAADLVSAPVGNPNLVRHLPDLVEVLMRLGRDAEALETTTRFAASAEVHPSRWAELALARCRALVAPPEEAIPAFDDVVAQFGPGDSEFDLALTLSARAWRLSSLGLRSSADLATAEAVAQFAAAGAHAWAGRIAAPAPHRSENVPDARLSLLTPAEREIALLVAEGLRNKEIAARLYVSVRTVELRLTTIYRKLGARSRSHLAAMLA